MYDDWVRRWITNLAPEAKRTYAIASLLHLCFKTYDFVDNMELIPESDKAWALRELRTEWATVWKQTPTLAPAPAPTPSDAAAANPAADPTADPHTLVRAGRTTTPAPAGLTPQLPPPSLHPPQPSPRMTPPSGRPSTAKCRSAVSSAVGSRRSWPSRRRQRRSTSSSSTVPRRHRGAED